jgi:hypothetical protein
MEIADVDASTTGRDHWRKRKKVILAVTIRGISQIKHAANL